MLFRSLEKSYLNMALLAMRRQDWQDAADQSDILLRLNPRDYVLGFYYNAVGHVNLQHASKALASAAEAVALDIKHAFPEAERLYGTLLAGQGRIKEAVDQLRNFVAHAQAGPTVDQAKTTLAGLEKKMAESK